MLKVKSKSHKSRDVPGGEDRWWLLSMKTAVVAGVCLLIGAGVAVAISRDGQRQGSDQVTTASAQVAASELSPSPLARYSPLPARPSKQEAKQAPKLVLAHQKNVRPQDRAKIVIGDKLPGAPKLNQLKASSQKFKFQHTGGTQQ